MPEPASERAGSESHRTWRWWTTAAIFTAASAYALWMVILNVALATGLVPWLVSGEHRMSTVRIRYDSAWVLWPSRVHVENFELDIDAYRYQLHLDIPEGEVDVALHARSIVGRRVSGVFRFKAPEGQVSDERLAAFGPVDGMPEPVRMSARPDLPDEDEAWAVELDAVDGDFVDLWINELHFAQVSANLRGALSSRAGNFFAIDGAQLEGTAEELLVGGQVLVNDWSSELTVDVEGYDPFSLTGRAVLGQLSVDLDASAKVVSLEPTRTFFEGDTDFALDGGEGSLTLRLIVAEGVLREPTALDYQTDALTVHVQDWVGRTRAHVTASVGSGQGPGRVRAGTDLLDVRVRRADEEFDGKPPIFAQKIEGFIATSSTNLVDDAFTIVDGRLRAPKVEVRDIAVLRGVSESVEPRSGSVSLSLLGNFVESDEIGIDLDGKLDNVVFAVDRSTVRTTVDFDLGLRSSPDFSEGRVGKLDIHVGQLGVKSPKGHSNGAWVDVSGGSLRWDAEGIEANVRGKLDDLRPILSHADERVRLVELVPDLESTTPLDFEVGLRKRGDVLDISVDRLTRPLLSIQGFRRSRGDAARSAFLIDRARVGLTRSESGDRDIDLAVDEDWLPQQTQWAKGL